MEQNADYPQFLHLLSVSIYQILIYRGRKVAKWCTTLNEIHMPFFTKTEIKKTEKRAHRNLPKRCTRLLLSYHFPTFVYID
jgi:hypothetical protein